MNQNNPKKYKTPLPKKNNKINKIKRRSQKNQNGL